MIGIVEKNAWVLVRIGSDVSDEVSMRIRQVSETFPSLYREFLTLSVCLRMIYEFDMDSFFLENHAI